MGVFPLVKAKEIGHSNQIYVHMDNKNNRRFLECTIRPSQKGAYLNRFVGGHAIQEDLKTGKIIYEPNDMPNDVKISLDSLLKEFKSNNKAFLVLAGKAAEELGAVYFYTTKELSDIEVGSYPHQIFRSVPQRLKGPNLAKFLLECLKMVKKI
jgi:hypothetical protein